MTEQQASEIGDLRIRAENRPKCPANWKWCFTDPVPFCLDFVSTEELRRTNWRCAICVRDHAPKEAKP